MPESIETTPEPAAEPAADAAGRKAVPRWHLHRRLYDWVLSLAHHRHATTSLFALSFAESSFFPIPPDVLQIALTIERRDKAWWFAGVSTVGSVLGGMAGYLIGMWGWEALGPFFFEHVPGFTHEHFEYVRGKYEAFALLTILTAAFTPIPYKVFTITAGVFGVPWWALIVGSLVGRAGRFYLVGAIMWRFGPPAKRFVDRYFNWLTLAFMLLVIAALWIVQATANGHGEAPEDTPATASPEGSS